MEKIEMKELIRPVDPEVMQAELTPGRFIRKTNKADNEIYVITADNAPNVMREIGRLRELSFRMAGAGTGKDCDIDRFDLEDKACHQLIVWNPELKEIIGGYRFTYGNKVSFYDNGQPNINSEHLFDFSENFIRDYLPYTIEMARAFVQPKYQSAQMGRKSLFALDNLWDGIGALVASGDVRYLAGKVTVYSTTPRLSRNAILYFLQKSFGDKEGLLTGKWPETYTDEEIIFYDNLFSASTYQENYKILNTFVKEHGESIPPLIHSYMELSPTMRTFGTCFDKDFGDVYDTAMMITIADVYPAKIERYVEPYRKMVNAQSK